MKSEISVPRDYIQWWVGRGSNGPLSGCLQTTRPIKLNRYQVTCGNPTITPNFAEMVKVKA